MNYQSGFYFKLSLLFATLSLLFIPVASSMATRQEMRSALSFFGASFKPNAQDPQEPQDKQKGKGRALSYLHEPPEVIEIVKVSGYKSDNWLEDFEIQLKNKSDKPIYYIMVALEVPEMKYSDDFRVMFLMEFGEYELMDRNKRPKDLEKSPHLNPDETITLKISENQRTFFKNRVKQRLQEGSLFTDQVTELIMSINTIRFADGTGYHGQRKLENGKVSQKISSDNGRASPASPDSAPCRYHDIWFEEQYCVIGQPSKRLSRNISRAITSV
jgi:hypothetical protein